MPPKFIWVNFSVKLIIFTCDCKSGLLLINQPVSRISRGKSLVPLNFFPIFFFTAGLKISFAKNAIFQVKFLLYSRVSKILSKFWIREKGWPILDGLKTSYTWLWSIFVRFFGFRPFTLQQGPTKRERLLHFQIILFLKYLINLVIYFHKLVYQFFSVHFNCKSGWIYSMFILISAQIGGVAQPIKTRIFSLFIQIPIFSRTTNRHAFASHKKWNLIYFNPGAAGCNVFVAIGF